MNKLRSLPIISHQEIVIRCLTICCLLMALLSAENSVIAQSPPVSTDALIEAAGTGDLNRVKSFIEEGQAVDSKDDTGVTALIEASYAGHRNIVEYLLNAGADPNVMDESGAVPLAEALAYDHTDIALALMLAGASADIANSEGKTPLHYAIELEDKKLMEAALAAGADIDAISSYKTALEMAVDQKDSRTVRALLEAGADPNLFFYLGPVSRAARLDQKNIIELLLDAGANVTPTLMHYAALSEVRLLESLLTSPDAGTVENLNAALDGSIKRGDLAHVQELLSMGADVNFKFVVDEFSYGPPLFQAARADQPRIANFLIEAGADVTGRGDSSYNSNPLSPISWAALHGHDDLLETIIQHGADTESAVFELRGLTDSDSYWVYNADFSSNEVEQAFSNMIAAGVPSDAMVRDAISNERVDLVQRWYPGIHDWLDSSSYSGVSFVYEELIEFANEIGNCGLKRGVKQTFTAKTGYAPPPERDPNNFLLTIPDRC